MSKVSYSSKKEAISKINYLRETLGKVNLRPYEEDGKWFLTHTKSLDDMIPPKASQLLEAVYLYTFKHGTDDDKVLMRKIFNKIESIKKKV